MRRWSPALQRLKRELKVLLLPKDPNDEKNVILEIRAGTGGDEASLFAAEVFRMYTRFAEQHRWKVEVLSMSESGGGRVQGSDCHHRGRARLFAAQVGERRSTACSAFRQPKHRAAYIPRLSPLRSCLKPKKSM